MSALSDFIRQRRKALGLTIEEAATLCGCSFIAWAKYERGDRTPSLALAKQVAAVLGVPLEELARHVRVPNNLRPVSSSS